MDHLYGIARFGLVPGSRYATNRASHLLVVVALLASSAVSRAQEPWLHLVGEPYDSSSMTASIYAPSSVGDPVFVLLGLDPLPLRQPVATAIGPFFLGQILEIIGVAWMPPDGWLHVPFTMPPVAPHEIGLHVPVQAYVTDRLTNPSTLPFDEPYYQWSNSSTITAPEPLLSAAFSDRLATGDLNDDGIQDLIVGAWKESHDNVFFSGRVYVMWGPDFGSVTALAPPVPKVFGVFGSGLVVADVDGDEVDDLVIGDGVGDPPVPGELANLRVYLGGASFSDSSAFSVPSPGSGSVYTQYARYLVARDLDADGFTDLALGVPKATDGDDDLAGRVDIYWGPSYTMRSEILSPDPGEDAFFGSRLISADVNGDGIPDLIEASSRDDYGGVTNAGSVHIFHAPDFSSEITIQNPNPVGFNSRFGSAIAATDFDADGMADLVVTDENGNAYIFWAPSFASSFRLRRPPQAGGPSYGYLASVGDANGDGLQDIAFSNVFGGPTGGGQVFVLLGPYFSTYLHLVDAGSDAGDEFGWTLVFTDLNGDGRQELLVGSDFADIAGVGGAGKATLFMP